MFECALPACAVRVHVSVLYCRPILSTHRLLLVHFNTSFELPKVCVSCFIPSHYGAINLFSGSLEEISAPILVQNEGLQEIHKSVFINHLEVISR